MSFEPKLKNWAPCANLFSESKANNYAILILNTPINFSFNPSFVVRLWKQAKVRVTVDGGTERWLTWLTMNKEEFKDIPHPDLITGDMDSINPVVLDYFKQIKTTEIVTTPDQNEIDFLKALKELLTYCSAHSMKLDTIYVLADTCGRLDQVMANLNVLYKAKYFWNDVDIFQIASSSLSWLLDEGIHEIHLPQDLINSEDWCALLPIGTPSIVTTTGLKWNLDNTALEFGGLISTSNTYGGSTTISIKNNSPLIWSMSIESLL